MINQKPAAIDGYEHIPRTWNSKFNMYAANVVPGEFYITDQEECIKTTLGSCISCCVRDKVNGIGGLNHFMLPQSNDNSNAREADIFGKEGCWAMEFLVNGILLNGGERRNLEVKIFGGAQLIAGLRNAQVGEKNIRFIKDYIKREMLNCVAEDIGGDCARTIYYFPQTGKVKLNRLAHNKDKEIASHENDYAGRLNKKQLKTGDIELF